MTTQRRSGISNLTTTFVLAVMGLALGHNLGLAQKALGPTPIDPATYEEQSTTTRRTPALFHDPTGRNALLTRMDFDELGLRMVGMASFNGETSVFLQRPGQRKQMIYQIGNVIGGFRIIDIQPEYTVFDRNGAQLWLAMGETPSYEESIEPNAALIREPFEVAHKIRQTALKIKNGAVAAADIVGSATKIAVAKAAERVKKLVPVLKPLVADIPFISRRLESRQVASAPSGALATRSKRPARFILPVQARVSSRFGYRQTPKGGGTKYHNGVDLAAPYRTPIAAAAGGRVLKLSRSWAKGLNILIEHDNGFFTAYFHLSKALVRKDQIVKQGQKIGLSGSSGRVTGPHLHFEIHKNGVPVDPSFYLAELSRL